MAKRTFLKGFATVWVICLIVASLQPFRPDATRGHHSISHQIEHVIVFGATGLIFLALSRNRREDWTSFGGVFVLAVFIESAQFAIYRMPEGFEWWDVRDDILGAAVAILLARYFQSAVKTLNS